MERRLLTFIIASSAFFFAYISLRVMLGVPPQQAERGEGIEAIDPLADADPGLADRAVADLLPDAREPAAEADDADEIVRPSRGQWLTLGSMDPNSDYLMLVTINTKGGGIERIELTARDEAGELKYQRVDVRSGYLGYLAGETAENADGVLVNVVGPGTPAAIAESDQVPPGLRVGDRIVAIAGQAVSNPADLQQILDQSRPGQQVSVEVIRAAAAEAQPAAVAAADDLDVDVAREDRDPPPEQAVTGLPARPIVFNVTLREHPLDLVRLAEHGGDDQIVGNLSRLSCLLTLSKVNQKSIAANAPVIGGMVDPTELVWAGSTAKRGDLESAELMLDLDENDMRAVGGQPLRLRRAYNLAPGDFHLGLTVEIENLGQETQDLAYRLEGVNGVTLEGWWYSHKISPNWGAAAARDVIFQSSAEGHQLISGYTLHKQAKRQPTNPDQAIFAPDSDPASRELKYIGVDAQYFLAAYLPSAEAGTEIMTDFRRAAAGIVADAAMIPRHQERAVNTSFSLDSVVASVGPQQSLRNEIRLFAGPKDPALLATYGLEQAVYHGWFSGPAKFLAGLLHLLYAFLGNYGIAIILLTVLVRGVMFPLSRKAAINAQKMQELAPELKKIADQYKDDMEGRMKAQRELQKRVGFNPLAGCLPMFLQLPVFIGLYRALSVDIELRQAAFSSATAWASNLAGPDMLAYWGDWLWDYLSGRGTGWLGPFFNILPVIVVLLFLLQQKLFMPPATDEQTAMTQKVMSWMTLVIGLFFFRVPAGLCIYFITSSLWGIAERVFVKRTIPQKKFFDAAVLEGTAPAAAPSTSMSIAERLRQQINPPEPAVDRPNRRKRPGTGKKKR